MPWQYNVLILITVLLGFLLCEFRPHKIKKAIYLVVVGVCFTLIAGFRYGIGYDFFSYQTIFSRVIATPWEKLLTFREEIGFIAILKLISFFTTDGQMMYVAMAIIISLVFAVFVFFYIKDRDAWIASLAYITLGFFYGTMNLVRQYFAATICLYAIHYMKKRKLIPFIIFVLIATSIHKSSLVLLPIYFIANIKPNWKIYTGYGVVSVLGYIFSVPILKLIIKILGVYESYNPETSYYMANGLSYQHLIIPVIVVAVLLIFSKKLLEIDRGNAVLINLALFNVIIYFFSTKHFILQRFSEVIYVSAIISIPMVVDLFRIKAEDKAEILAKKKLMNKKGQNPTMQKKYQEEYMAEKAKLKDKRNFYILSIVLVIIVLYVNNLFIAGMKYHKVFPYFTVKEKEVVDIILQESKK